MSTAKRREPLVHYISPFGSPAWMTRDQAEGYLAQDEARYEFHAAAGTLDYVLSDEQRRIGPPRIEVPR